MSLLKIEHCNLDIFLRLPTELQEHVCHPLDTHSLLAMCCVSTAWRQAVSSLKSLWKDRCRKLGNVAMGDSVDWKEETIRCLKEIDRRIRLGNAFSHHVLLRVPLEQRLEFGVKALMYSQGFLAAGLCTGSKVQVVIWRMADNRQVEQFNLNTGSPVTSFCLCGGNLLSLGFYDGAIVMKKLDGCGKLTSGGWIQEGGSEHPMLGLTVAPSLNLLAVFDWSDSMVQIRKLCSGELLMGIPATLPCYMMQISTPPWSHVNNSLVLYGVNRELQILSWPANCREDVTTVLRVEKTLGFDLVGDKLMYLKLDVRSACVVPSIVTRNLTRGTEEVVYIPEAKPDAFLLAAGSRYALLLCGKKLMVVVPHTGALVGSYLRHDLQRYNCVLTPVHANWLSGLDHWRPEEVLFAYASKHSVHLVKAAMCAYKGIRSRGTSAQKVHPSLCSM